MIKRLIFCSAASGSGGSGFFDATQNRFKVIILFQLAILCKGFAIISIHSLTLDNLYKHAILVLQMGR